MPFQSAPLAGKDNKGEGNDEYAVHGIFAVSVGKTMKIVFKKQEKVSKIIEYQHPKVQGKTDGLNPEARVSVPFL